MANQTAKWYPTNVTLGTGIRVTTVTVTTTRTSLESLLNTAVSGRVSLPGRRSLQIRNLDVTNPFYITESATQTITSGWNVEAGSTISFEASESFTQNQTDFTVDTAGGAGFYLACSSGTISVKVLEGK